MFSEACLGILPFLLRPIECGTEGDGRRFQVKVGEHHQHKEDDRMPRGIYLVAITATIVVVIFAQIFFRTRLLYTLFFAELALFDCYKARTQAFARARSSFHGGAWFVLLVLVILLGFWKLIGSRVPSSSLLLYMTIFFFTPMLIASVIFYWIFRSRLRRSLRQQLVERGYALCIKCGYDLRGQTDPRCPECGKEFDEKLLKQDGG